MWRLWELLKWGVAGAFSVTCLVLMLMMSVLAIIMPYLLAGFIVLLLLLWGFKEWLDSLKDPTKDP